MPESQRRALAPAAARRRVGHSGLARRAPALAAAVMAMLAVPADAAADQLTVAHAHYLAASGAIAATVRATGPLDTAVAIDLNRTVCPARPAEADTAPGVLADGRAHLLLANPPVPGASGAFLLCVWTVHDDGAIGARYGRPVTVPRQPPPAWDPVAGTAHPWWWPVLDWSVPLLVAYIALAWLRRLRARRRAIAAESPWRQGTAHARQRQAGAAAGGGDHDRSEADTIELGDAPGGRRPVAEDAEVDPRSDRASTLVERTGHPFVPPPSPSGEEPPASSARTKPKAGG
jgi:hypothetical protein